MCYNTVLSHLRQSGLLLPCRQDEKEMTEQDDEEGETTKRRKKVAWNVVCWNKVKRSGSPSLSRIERLLFWFSCSFSRFGYKASDWFAEGWPLSRTQSMASVAGVIWLTPRGRYLLYTISIFRPKSLPSRHYNEYGSAPDR